MPTFNRAQLLELTLASFVAQSSQDYELIVVDDGSTDSTAELLQRYRKRLPLRYFHQKNRGRAIARNLALARARGEVLIFSDDDRIVSPGFVEGHLDACGRGAAKPVVLGWREKSVLSHWSPELAHVVSVEMLTRNPALLERLGEASSLQLLDPVALARGDARELRPLEQVEAYWREQFDPVLRRFGQNFTGFHLPWFFSSTGNMSLLHSHLDEVGGFDPAYVRWGAEDTDLGYALARSGGQFQVSREAASVHQLHRRGRGEHQGFLANLQYFTQKYDTLEPYLWVEWALHRLDTFVAQDVVAAARSGHRLGSELTALYRSSVLAMLSLELGSIPVSNRPGPFLNAPHS